MKFLLLLPILILSACATAPPKSAFVAGLEYNIQHPNNQIGFPKVYGKYCYLDRKPTSEEYKRGFRWWHPQDYHQSPAERLAQLELDLELAKFDVLSAEGEILNSMSGPVLP